MTGRLGGALAAVALLASIAVGALLAACQTTAGRRERARVAPLAISVNLMIDTGANVKRSADVRVFDPQGVWVSTLHVGVDLTRANLAHVSRMALEKV
jgi:hypothetical protein